MRREKRIRAQHSHFQSNPRWRAVKVALVSQ
jgi:hypothetical protein